MCSNGMLLHTITTLINMTVTFNRCIKYDGDI